MVDTIVTSCLPKYTYVDYIVHAFEILRVFIPFFIILRQRDSKKDIQIKMIVYQTETWTYTSKNILIFGNCFKNACICHPRSVKTAL